MIYPAMVSSNNATPAPPLSPSYNCYACCSGNCVNHVYVCTNMLLYIQTCYYTYKPKLMLQCKVDSNFILLLILFVTMIIVSLHRTYLLWTYPTKVHYKRPEFSLLPSIGDCFCFGKKSSPWRKWRRILGS